MRVIMQTKTARDVGGHYLVYEEGQAYDAPATLAAVWTRRGIARGAPHATASAPTVVLKRGLDPDARHELDDLTRMHPNAPQNRMLPHPPTHRDAHEKDDDEDDHDEDGGGGSAAAGADAGGGLTFRDLQEALKARGLSAKGTRAELEARLQDVTRAASTDDTAAAAEADNA